jgi:hypothetical protein
MRDNMGDSETLVPHIIRSFSVYKQDRHLFLHRYNMRKPDASTEMQLVLLGIRQGKMS